jgi:pimeloyl-ACP methyl ester carboxylesterase
LNIERMADDIVGLMGHLGISKADVMGYSLGGGVALRTAIQHAPAVKRLIVVSAAFRRSGWYPEILSGMAQMGPQAAEPMKQTPMYQVYSSVAPKVSDWPVLLTKMGDLLRQDYDWSREAAGIRSPTLLVYGDADAVRTAHAVECFEVLGGGKKDGGWDGAGISKARLSILPGVTHYNIFSSPALASAAANFLNS